MMASSNRDTRQDFARDSVTEFTLPYYSNDLAFESLICVQIDHSWINVQHASSIIIIGMGGVGLKAVGGVKKVSALKLEKSGGNIH